MAIAAGQLTRRIDVMEPTQSRDSSYGSFTKPFAKKCTVWGMIQQLRGQEKLIAAQLDSTTTHKVTIRWSPQVKDITSAWQLRYDGRTMEIDSVLVPDTADEDMVLMVREER